VLKVIIAGGRDFNDYELLTKSLEKILSNYESKYIEIVSGMCRGADLLGIKYAETKGISIREFPADWNKYGNRAGPIRNRQMAEYADALVVFWDGKSRGTKSMINEAENNELKTRIIKY
jgi:YspA, cpYpsA-related SLOG family